MTSEVALLNKSCIALAADSATTVTYWDNGEEKTRYFKGANKIFNLSRAHPVGLMTYASASLQGVPWEIIAKAYRAHVGMNAHDDLTGYANDFFSYIAGNVHMFPVAVQEQQFKLLADRVAAKIARPVVRDSKFIAEPDEVTRRTTFTSHFTAQSALLNSSKFVPGASQSDTDSALLRFSGDVQVMLAADSWYDLIPRDCIADLATAAIGGIYKEDFTGLQSSGLAFAGYGDKEFFPRMMVYRCSGMVLGKLLSAIEKEVVIDQQNASDLVPLAMSEMISTFIWGIGDGGISDIMGSFRTQSAAMLQAVKNANHMSSGIDVDSFIEEAVKKHVGDLVKRLHDSHRAPLHRVIASLPLAEMAELAETLVFMESMKERVTTPSESVSGPIDVAVISKGDGFIWIKRKHYFDPKLNPRFISRNIT
jgi:hypothetical protein